MLQMSTDLLRVNRLEKKASAWILANAVTGSFVSFNATGVGQPALATKAVPIFTESNGDGSVGFTGDVGVTGGVTVLLGQFQAITDQFIATTIALNDKLYVTTAGKLANAVDAGLNAAAEAAGTVVAICTKAPHTVDYKGRLGINVIEFVTV
jgi:hypothetical protein